MEIVPFGRLRVSTSAVDEEYVSILLDKSGQKRVKCGICGSYAFKLEALIKMNLDVSISKTDRKILVREKKPMVAMILNISECSTCGSTDFDIEED